MDTKDQKSTGLPSFNTDQLQDIEERLKEVKERTSDFVKKYPMTSIAIAAGVGFIIGKLLSGRRS